MQQPASQVWKGKRYMNQIRISATALLVVFCCGASAAAQDLSLKKSIDRELLLLGSFVDLEDAVSEQFRKDVEEIMTLNFGFSALDFVSGV